MRVVYANGTHHVAMAVERRASERCMYETDGQQFFNNNNIDDSGQTAVLCTVRSTVVPVIPCVRSS